MSPQRCFPFFLSNVFHPYRLMSSTLFFLITYPYNLSFLHPLCNVLYPISFSCLSMYSVCFVSPFYLVSFLAHTISFSLYQLICNLYRLATCLFVYLSALHFFNFFVLVVVQLSLTYILHLSSINMWRVPQARMAAAGRTKGTRVKVQ